MLPEKAKLTKESKMSNMQSKMPEQADDTEEVFRTFIGKRKSHPPLLILVLLCLLRFQLSLTATEILSKSKLERCSKTSDSDNLSCENKIVINMVVPSSSSGGEASIVAELVEVDENDTQKMQTIRVPPIITINKSAAYALYELSYLRDAAYKPEEFYAKTRKCQPDASSKVVKICERLRDLDGHIIEHTQVAYVLGQLQHKMAASALADIIRNVDEHPMVRQEAAEALGSIAGDWLVRTQSIL